MPRRLPGVADLAVVVGPGVALELARAATECFGDMTQCHSPPYAGTQPGRQHQGPWRHKRGRW